MPKFRLEIDTDKDEVKLFRYYPEKSHFYNKWHFICCLFRPKIIEDVQVVDKFHNKRRSAK